MEVKFGKRFQKDIANIGNDEIVTAVHAETLKAEKAKDIRHINIYKKLKGSKTAYAIRIGDYRIGIYVENNIVTFARCLHRNNIYKVFP